MPVRRLLEVLARVDAGPVAASSGGGSSPAGLLLRPLVALAPEASAVRPPVVGELVPSEDIVQLPTWILSPVCSTFWLTGSPFTVLPLCAPRWT